MQPRSLQEKGEHEELAPPAVQQSVEVELDAVAGPAAAVREDSAAVAGPAAAVREDSGDVAGPAAAVREVSGDVAGPAAAVREDSDDVAGPAAAAREDSGDAEAQLGENIFHDAGTWPLYVPDELRVELVRRGPLGFQNKDGPFPANPETNRSMNRRWFYKVLGNGEQLLRSWLMYSPSLVCGQ